MKIFYDPEFIQQLKRLNVRIRKSFTERIAIFQNNPNDSVLDNHPLEKEYLGHRSIDITVDFRAIFKEVSENKEITYYFFLIGTHDQLFKKTIKDN